MRELKISKKNLPLNIALIYIISLGLFDSLLNVFIPDSIRIVLCVICAGIILFSRKWKFSKRLLCDLFFVLAAVVFCWNTDYITSFGLFAFMRYLLVFLLLFVARNIYNFPSIILNFYSVLSLVHVFATIWLKFDGWSYRNLVVKMFDSERQQLLLSHYSNGWIPGLANHYSSNGMYLAVTILSVASLWLSTTSYREKKKAKVLLFLACIAMLLTGKRAHAIFIIVTIFVMYYAYTVNKKRGRIFKIGGLICLTLVVVYIGYTLFPNLFSFIGRFEETIAAGDVTQGRTDTWNIALFVFLSNPIFGIGWAQFSKIADKYEVTTNVHNIYIQLLCETGIVGFAIFIIMFILMLAMSVKIFTKMRKNIISSDEVGQRNMMFSIGMQVFFLLYGFTGNPLYDAPMFIPYFLTVAVTTYYWAYYKKVVNIV